MSVDIEQAIENAANSIDRTSGTHPTEEIKARALISIANSLAAIAAMMHKSVYGYHLDVDTVEFAKKVKR